MAGASLHPLLTSLPTGAVATTLALDAAAVPPARGSTPRDSASASSIVDSLGAAGTGLNDW